MKYNRVFLKGTFLCILCIILIVLFQFDFELGIGAESNCYRLICATWSLVSVVSSYVIVAPEEHSNLLAWYREILYY